MTPATHAPRPIAGAAELVVPEDLFDLMVPEDPSAAAATFDDVLRRLFPGATAEQVELLTGGLLRWRSHLLAQGVLMHGIVAVEAHDAEPAAHWHIFAGVMDVPSSDDGVDVAEVARRHLDATYGEAGCYTERFDTAMGWGVGLITDVPVAPGATLGPAVDRLGSVSAASGARSVPETMGLALALSGAHGQQQALSVIGLCLDNERLTELATIVAVIAGESTIRVEDPATTEDQGHDDATS